MKLAHTLETNNSIVKIGLAFNSMGLGGVIAKN